VIKKLGILFTILLFLPLTHAQSAIDPNAPPTCDQVALFTKITQEHQLTRKFMIDTYNEKSQLFFNEADKRMEYLEKEYKRQLNTAVFTLGFLWLFITILVFSLFGLLSVWLRQRQYKKMKKDIAEEAIRKVREEVEKKARLNVVKERPSVEIRDTIPQPPPPPTNGKESSFEDVFARLKEVQ
jgi:hypothetical protein